MCIVHISAASFTGYLGGFSYSRIFQRYICVYKDSLQCTTGYEIYSRGHMLANRDNGKYILYREGIWDGDFLN